MLRKPVVGLATQVVNDKGDLHQQSRPHFTYGGNRGSQGWYALAKRQGARNLGGG